MFGKKLGHVNEKRSLSLHLYDRFVRKFYSHDLNAELQFLARRESARYVKSHMTAAIMFRNRWRLLDSAVEEASKEGLVLEFGVEKGASANFIARRLRELGSSQPVDAFDSFEGLPEEWSGTYEKRGKFSQRGKLPAVLPNVRLHKGWFADTLGPFLAEDPRPLSFLHIDCDLYSSTREVLDLVGPRLRPGTIVAFDEYFNYHNWREHEFRAWQEFVAEKRISYLYRGFSANGGQVYLKVV